LIMLCSASGATVGSLVTGNIFQNYGGTTAFYWTLCPIVVLALSLVLLNHLEQKATAALAV
jgi:FHS family glucose/mannose:H+ symporter-like MFS transporter